MSDPILQIENLTVGYEQHAVLTDIDFAVKTGQFISIVAPNGTGKSTLLKTIAGVLKPLSGSVLLKNRALTSFSRRELARQIAVVGADVTAQEYTVTQLVTMGRFSHIGRFAALSQTDLAIVRQAMLDVEISEKKDCLCTELSQGERQKVIIARALAQQPDLLLLDEPTAHLDICNQFGILKMVKNLASQRNMAVIAVLHDINLAIQFSTHLLFLQNGRMLSYGETEEVLNEQTLKKLYGMDFMLYHDAAATYVRPIVT